MLKFKFLLLFSFSLFLSGCTSGPKLNSIDVVKTEIVYVTIPDNILAECIPEKPIELESYLQLTLPKRESYLTDYSISLLGTLKTCNLQLEQARSLNKKPKD